MSTSDPSTGSKSLKKQRFLIALAKLLGVKPLEQDPLAGSAISDKWHLEECLAAILDGSDDAIQLTFDLFNVLMLHVGRGVVQKPFFSRFFAEISTVTDWEKAVEDFRIEAMWLYGNFKFALNEFAECTSAELDQLLHRPALAPPPAERDEFTEVEAIPQSDLWLLGYVSSNQILFLAMVRDLVNREIAGENTTALWGSLADKHQKMTEACKLAGVTLTFSGGQPSFSGAPLADVRRQIDATHSTLKSSTAIAREIGVRNTRRYLAMPFIDVYVATSMRDNKHFIDQSNFIKEVFGDADLSKLKLRFFDPTLSFVDDRITKGIVECLMLRRAKVTIYNAGSSDSLGKDSELAATLAQGKPVIVYVPEGEEARADLFRADHPLGLQVATATGVAHGILVVRSAKECADMLRALLLHQLKFEIRHEGGNYKLVEQTTQSVLRVVSDDPFLTHAFWTYFHSEVERN